MSQFDDLRRQAERIIGSADPERVKRIVESIGTDRRDMVDVGGVQFYPDRQRSAAGDNDMPHSDQVVPPAKDSRSVPLSNNPQNVSVDRSIIPPPDHQAMHSRSASERIINTAVENEYGYAKLGLVLGLACIIGGIILGLNGVGGATSWTAKLLGLESQINDAAPGVVLFIVGVFYVWITKPKIRMRDLNG